MRTRSFFVSPCHRQDACGMTVRANCSILGGRMLCLLCGRASLMRFAYVSGRAGRMKLYLRPPRPWRVGSWPIKGHLAFGLVAKLGTRGELEPSHQKVRFCPGHFAWGWELTGLADSARGRSPNPARTGGSCWCSRAFGDPCVGLESCPAQTFLDNRLKLCSRRGRGVRN